MGKPREGVGRDFTKKRVSKLDLLLPQRLTCLPVTSRAQRAGRVSSADLGRGEHFPPALHHRERSLKSVPLPLQPFLARDVHESSREEEQLLPGDGLHKDLLKVGDVVESTPKTRVCI